MKFDQNHILYLLKASGPTSSTLTFSQTALIVLRSLSVHLTMTPVIGNQYGAGAPPHVKLRSDQLLCSMTRNHKRSREWGV